MPDDSNHPESGALPPRAPSRRGFLKAAGVAAAGAMATGAAVATVSCTPPATGDRGERETGRGAARDAGLDRQLLGALGDIVLPESLGAAGRAAAVTAFVAWVDGYAPVAEEMHGYGYSDIRYLPPDPAPGWRAQLEGIDLLARKAHRKSFAELDGAARKQVVTAALASAPGDRLPDPLGASHVAVALLAHWAGSPAAWDLALGAQVGAGTCRKLDGVTSKPLPIVGRAT